MTEATDEPTDTTTTDRNAAISFMQDLAHRVKKLKSCTIDKEAERWADELEEMIGGTLSELVANRDTEIKAAYDEGVE